MWLFHCACLHNLLFPVQAVHFRVGVMVEDNHTAGVFVTTMLAILGGPFRLFEMMGLQQPWTSHAIVSVLYLVVHPMAAATGIRYEQHADCKPCKMLQCVDERCFVVVFEPCAAATHVTISPFSLKKRRLPMNILQDDD